jgi:hypothetical protein
MVVGEEELSAVVRGSPTRATELMEAFQEAYVRSVAAAAGCVVYGRPEIDEGIDITFTHTSDIHLKDDHKAYLEIQMKSSADGPVEQGSVVTATMRRSRYDLFRAVDVTVNKIVVILHMPADMKDWISLDDESLLLRHRAYWVSVRGSPPITDGVNSAPVKAPVTQPFDDIALCRIMERIGQGGVP